VRIFEGDVVDAEICTGPDEHGEEQWVEVSSEVVFDNAEFLVDTDIGYFGICEMESASDGGIEITGNIHDKGE
jgi:hypothetical protein